MALPADARGRSDATTENTVPNVYNEESERFLYEANQLQRMAWDQSARLLGKPGKTLELYKETEFSVSELTEGTDTPLSALTFDNEQLTVGWYGDAKMISKETLSEEFEFVFNDSLNRGAAGAMGVNRDHQILLEWENTSTGVVYPIDTGATRFTDANVDATATFDYEVVSEANRLMRLNNRKARWLVIHPNQEKSVKNIDSFQRADYYDAMVIKNGIIGTIDGAEVVVHSGVQSSEATSGTTVYHAFAVSERAFVYAQKVAPVMEFDEETKRSRTVTFHYYEAFGVKNLHDEGIVPIFTA